MKGKSHIISGLMTYSNYMLLTNNKFDIFQIPLVMCFSILPDLDIHSSTGSKLTSKIPLKSITIISIILATILNIFIMIKYDFKYLLILIPISFILINKYIINSTFIKNLSSSLFFLITFFLFSYYFNNAGKFKYIFIFLAVLPWFSHRTFSHSLLSLVILWFCLYPLKNNTNYLYLKLSMISYLFHIIPCDIITKKGVPLFWPLTKKKISLNIFKSKYINKNIDTIFLSIYGLITILISLKVLKILL